MPYSACSARSLRTIAARGTMKAQRRCSRCAPANRASAATGVKLGGWGGRGITAALATRLRIRTRREFMGALWRARTPERRGWGGGREPCVFPLTINYQLSTNRIIPRRVAGAKVAELVNALDLGSSAARLG